MSLQKARTDYWTNRPDWTNYQFVFLKNDYEPVPYEELEEANNAKLIQQIRDWNDWCRDCPGIRAGELRPMTTPLPKLSIIQWALSLKGVQLPGWMVNLLEPAEDATAKREQTIQTLGPAESQHVYITIGALALALVEATGPETRTVEDPNISALARRCSEFTKEISGMSDTSLRTRISAGIRLLKAS